MTKKIIEISVSSSYEGRDKSIVKSILYIDDHYGYLTLKYTEDASVCSVYLTKINGIYFAFLKGRKSKISIGSELNPNTILLFFQHISESAELDVLDDREYGNSSLFEYVLKYLNSDSDQLMEIRSNQKLRRNTSEKLNVVGDSNVYIILNCKRNIIYSNTKLEPQLQLGILNSSIDEFEINLLCSDQCVNLNYSMSLQDFKWNIGLTSNDDIFHFKFKSEKKLIKQIAWPDYGHYPYQKEFLHLSSMLNKHESIYFDLIKISRFKESVINTFLNVKILLNYLVLIPNKNSNLVKIKLNKNKFIKSLKKYFSFSFSSSLSSHS